MTAGGVYIYKKSPKYGQSPPWYPTPSGGSIKSSWEESYAKAAKLVEKMSLTEKVNITTGTGWSMGLAVGQTGAATNVGFPSLALQDGPLGLRFSDHSTAFPAGITVGATWNKELMYRRGKAHGLEARLKGINVLLGPCVGPLGRMPAGGRNWEGFGSDPYLQGVAAAETIKGIQEEGVMATIKVCHSIVFSSPLSTFPRIMLGNLKNLINCPFPFSKCMSLCIFSIIKISPNNTPYTPALINRIVLNY